MSGEKTGSPPEAGQSAVSEAAETPEAADAAPVTVDELGIWLAENRGILADVPPDILDQIDI
jgi:hypothetical protein